MLETETRFLQTGLSVSSARIPVGSKLSGRYSHPSTQMLKSAPVTAGNCPPSRASAIAGLLLTGQV